MCLIYFSFLDLSKKRRRQLHTLVELTTSISFNQSYIFSVVSFVIIKYSHKKDAMTYQQTIYIDKGNQLWINRVINGTPIKYINRSFPGNITDIIISVITFSIIIQQSFCSKYDMIYLLVAFMRCKKIVNILLI